MRSDKRSAVKEVCLAKQVQAVYKTKLKFLQTICFGGSYWNSTVIVQGSKLNGISLFRCGNKHEMALVYRDYWSALNKFVEKIK